jgi:protease-4
MLGSVGAVIQLRNVVKAMEEEGVKVYTFKSGSLKMAGNPYEELTDEAKEHYQKLVDANAEVFIKNVAAARGLSADKVKKSVGDGRTMLAREALQNRLIDKIGTLSDTLKIVQTDVKRRSRAR